MVKPISEVDVNSKIENVQVFDVTLVTSEPSSTKNYANCYCYGPAYPPCCG